MGFFISRHLRFDCRDFPDCRTVRVPHSKYLCTLHSRPDPSAVAEQLTEPNGDVRENRLALVEDIVEMLARDPKQGGDLAPVVPVAGITSSRSNSPGSRHRSGRAQSAWYCSSMNCSKSTRRAFPASNSKVIQCKLSDIRMRGAASHQFHAAWRWQADQSYSARAMHRKERLRYEQEA